LEQAYDSCLPLSGGPLLMGGLCISIVNYNTGPLLAACLDSIRKQGRSDLHILVVDNVSVDKFDERFFCMPKI
jgi:GT2 family glycosyltransferase